MVSQAEQLLTTIEKDLHTTINSKLVQIEEVVVSRLDTIANDWEEKRQEISSDFEKLSQELSSVKESLNAEIDGRLTKTEALTDKRLGGIEKEWQEQVGSLKQGLDEELVSFRVEVKNDLIAHQQGVERQITEFLAKQNMLIQNLTQQIDGFQRATQTLASEQQTMNQKIGTLQVAASKIPVQEAEIGTLQKEMQAQGTRLGQIINRLQGVRFIGGVFKGL